MNNDPWKKPVDESEIYGNVWATNKSPSAEWKDKDNNNTIKDSNAGWSTGTGEWKSRQWEDDGKDKDGWEPPQWDEKPIWKVQETLETRDEIKEPQWTIDPPVIGPIEWKEKAPEDIRVSGEIPSWNIEEPSVVKDDDKVKKSDTVVEWPVVSPVFSGNDFNQKSNFQVNFKESNFQTNNLESNFQANNLEFNFQAINLESNVQANFQSNVQANFQSNVQSNSETNQNPKPEPQKIVWPEEWQSTETPWSNITPNAKPPVNALTDHDLALFDDLLSSKQQFTPDFSKALPPPVLNAPALSDDAQHLLKQIPDQCYLLSSVIKFPQLNKQD